VKRLLLALTLLLAGCGGSSVASETGSNLAKIHSGVLDLKLLVTPHGSGEPFGFELKGPFSFRPGKLPVARIAYTQIANGSSATATFVSTASQAWVVSSGGTRQLTGAQLRSLRMGDTLSGLDIGRWIRDERVSDGPGDLERVRGKLDVVATANGLSDVAALAGRNVDEIRGDDAKRLEAATRGSTVELLTTKGDHLLRRLALRANLGFDVPASLRRALGTTVGATVDFRLVLAHPNSRVVVQAP